GVDVSDTALAQAVNPIEAPEQALARKLAEWPRLVEIAAKGHEPHRVAFYLYDLASDLHGLWAQGNGEESLRFIQPGKPATTQEKIALARAVSVVIAAGLGILGVTPVDEMR
ncbi:MAG: DALR anticodon-binding domain-containing protein, partial [Shimia sp.]